MRRILVAAALLLAACGNEPEAPRTCAELPGSVDARSFCLARFECGPGQPQFRGHLCLCWEELCLCFVSRSTRSCDAPDDAECGTESSMIIVGPGVCAHDAQSRETFLGGEYERLLGDWEGERHAVRE